MLKTHRSYAQPIGFAVASMVVGAITFALINSPPRTAPEKPTAAVVGRESGPGAPAVVKPVRVADPNADIWDRATEPPPNADRAPKPMPVLKPIDAMNMRVGQAGPFDSTTRVQFELTQIIDAENALVTPIQIVYPRTLASGNRRETIYTTEPTTGAPLRRAGASFWLSAIDFSNHVDGQVVALPGNYEINGTKQYTTVNGTRTVFLVGPLN